MDILQWHQLARIHGRPDAEPGTLHIRHYLPLEDGVQHVRALRLIDSDPRVDAEVRIVEFDGQPHRYVHWRIHGLGPGDFVQIGFTAWIEQREFVAPWDRSPGTNPSLVFRDLRPFAPLIPQPDGGGAEQPVTTSSPAGPQDAAALDLLLPTAGDYVGIDQPRSVTLDLWADAIGQCRSLLDGAPDDLLSTLDALVQTRLRETVKSPGASAPDWGTRTRAQRMATFFNAIIQARNYGSNEAPEDPVYSGWTLPGTGRFCELIRETAWVARHAALALGLGGLFGGALTSEDLSRIAAGLLADPSFPYRTDYQCTCSENTLLLVWFMRLVGLPCREVGGELSSPRAVSEEGLRMPDSPSYSGHRIAEVWDPESESWSFIDSTARRLGPEMDPRNFVVYLRGNSGPGRPLGWGYRPDAVARETDGQYDTTLYDGSPEACLRESLHNAFRGAAWAELQGATSVAAEAIGSRIGLRRLAFGSRTRVVSEAWYTALQGLIDVALAGTRGAGADLGVFDWRLGMLFNATVGAQPQCSFRFSTSPSPLPAGSGPVTPVPYLLAIIAAADPQIGADLSLKVTRDTLLGASPCLGALAAPNALDLAFNPVFGLDPSDPVERVFWSGGEGGVDGRASSEVSDRSRWAWVAITGLAYWRSHGRGRCRGSRRFPSPRGSPRLTPCSRCRPLRSPTRSGVCRL